MSEDNTFWPIIHIRDIIDDDFINYKKVSMLIAMPYCTFKCNVDGKKLCHNQELIHSTIVCMTYHKLVERYLNNMCSEAIIFAGLEPMVLTKNNTRCVSKFTLPSYCKWLYDKYNFPLYSTSFTDMINFICLLRIDYRCQDNIVIYSGYTKEELLDMSNPEHGYIQPIMDISKYYKGDIIIKYGRYLDNNTSHLDPILGVKLASSNQYAELYRDGEKIE